jgi:WD40 repeat protein
VRPSLVLFIEENVMSAWQPLLGSLLILGQSAVGLAGYPAVNVSGHGAARPLAAARWELPSAAAVTAAATRAPRLAATGSDGVTRVWDTASGREIGRFGEPASAARPALSPDGRVLAVARADGTIHVWQVDTGKRLHEVKGAAAESVLALGFDADGRSLIAVTTKALPNNVLYFNFFIEAADVKELQTIPKIKDLDQPDKKEDETKQRKKAIAVVETVEVPLQVDVFQTLTFVPDGAAPMTLTPQDATLRVRRWDMQTGKPIGEQTIQDERRLARSIVNAGGAAPVLSADGRLLVLTDGAESVTVWDLVAGRPLADFQPAAGVAALTLSPDGRNLAVGSTERIAIHEVLTGKERCRLGGVATCLAFAADGRTLAAGRADGAVQLWDTVTLRELGLRQERLSAVTTVAFAGGQSLIAAAGSPQKSPANVWRLVTDNGQQQVQQANVMMWSPSTKQVVNLTTPIVAWKMPDVQVGMPASERTIAALWDDLAGADAGRAYQAVCALPGNAETTAFLGKRLQPADQPDAQRMSRLIAHLEDERYAVRQRATEELARLGTAATPQLREALTRQPTLDKRLRVEALLGRLANPWVPSAEELRALRALEVLERTATPAARQILERLAGGASYAPLTQQAKMALQRLAN